MKIGGENSGVEIRGNNSADSVLMTEDDFLELEIEEDTMTLVTEEDISALDTEDDWRIAEVIKALLIEEVEAKGGIFEMDDRDFLELEIEECIIKLVTGEDFSTLEKEDDCFLL